MINVMIVDDDYNVRSGLVEMLDWDKLNARVIATAEDGEQAIKLLKEFAGVDLIILDVCMPHVDGLSVARYVYENEMETQIILLSAHAEFEYAREALKYGVREYIIKPVNRSKLNQLTEAVRAVSFEKESAIGWRVYLHGSELREDLNRALRHKDEEALAGFLAIDDKFPRLSFANCKEYYIALVGIVRDYIKSGGKDTDIWDNILKLLCEISDMASLRSFLKDSMTPALMTASNDHPRHGTGVVSLAKEYIKNNLLTTDLHSYDVASHLNLSVDHLSRLFKSAGENSLSDYIINVKIDKAKEIIANSSYSIRQVAQMLGYTDPNYFVRVFKKKTGVTPTEYRTNAKEEI